MSWRAAEFRAPGPQAAGIEAADITAGEQGAAAPDTSVAFTVPGSDAFPVDLFHLRRGLVGGHLARAWVSFDHGGTTYALHFRQGGSGADPTAWVAALSGATAIEVDLGSGSVTAAEVADAVVLALDSEGIQSVADDALVTITGPGVGNLVVPPNVDTTDESLRGMWGSQRDDWGAGGDGQTLNSNGGTGGTGSVSLGALGQAGRILGVYLWTRTDTVAMDVRLWASTGPAYSLTPGATTTLDQGRETIQGFGATVFSDPVAVSSSAELRAHYASSTATEGIRFRTHGSTPVGRGQLGAGQNLIWDTTRSASAATAIGASYTPTVDASFGIYTAIGVVFEAPDGSGRYPANGRWTVLIGDHNPDPDHGVQFDADWTLLAGEVTCHRVEWPSWAQMRLTSVARTVAAIGADEDSRLAVYSWADLDRPSSTPAVLIADLGRMGIVTPGVANAFTVSLELGTDAVAERTLSASFNYVRNNVAPLAAYVLPVFLEPTGDGSYLDAWEDERELWHDYIPGACAMAPVSGVIEYRTRVSAGNLGMPTTWAATYPTPMATFATDDSPPAIPLDRSIAVHDGITTA